MILAFKFKNQCNMQNLILLPLIVTINEPRGPGPSCWRWAWRRPRTWGEGLSWGSAITRMGCSVLMMLATSSGRPQLEASRAAALSLVERVERGECCWLWFFEVAVLAALLQLAAALDQGRETLVARLFFSARPQ